MQIICKNMQKYAAHFFPKKYAKICKNMQIICMLYAKTCKICNHDFYMQNMQKYALPTLLRQAQRRSCAMPVEHGHSDARARRRHVVAVGQYTPPAFQVIRAPREGIA